MHNTQNAPVKITKAANARDNTPALTTVTVQKTLQQPLTLGHLITTLAGVALGALIMTCVQTTTAKQTNPTTTGSVVTSNQTTPEETDIVLPPSALAPTLREHAESQVSSHDLQNVGNTLTVTAESAYALLSDEHYDDAIAAYHTLLRTDPTMEPERGYLIEALGQSPSLQSEKELLQLQKATPGDARIFAALGNFAMNENDYARAVDFYSKAVAKDNHKAQYWMALGIACDHANDKALAYDAYSHAASLFVKAADKENVAKLNERMTYLLQALKQ